VVTKILFVTGEVVKHGQTLPIGLMLMNLEKLHMLIGKKMINFTDNLKLLKILFS